MVTAKADYKNWFVLQVRATREYFVKNTIEKHANEDIKMIVFSRELLLERKDRVFKGKSLLFPSYVFVHKKAYKALEVIKKKCMDEFVKPLCFKDRGEKCRICFSQDAPCQVYEREMEFLLNYADDTGIISMSYGIEKDGAVQIVNGPLKHFSSNILWINKKKKKACVEVELFKQKLPITLGFNLLTVNTNN